MSVSSPGELSPRASFLQLLGGEGQELPWHESQSMSGVLPMSTTLKGANPVVIFETITIGHSVM